MITTKTLTYRYHRQPQAGMWDSRLMLGLLALAVLSVLVRVPFFDIPVGSDEGSYAYVARFWSSDFQLYQDIPFNRTPVVFLIYKAILTGLGSSVESIRLGGALYNVLSLVALFFITQDVFSRRDAWIAAGMFAVVSAAPHVEGFSANLELFTMFPLILSAHLTWHKRWFWAGFAAGIAMLVKQIGMSGLLLALAWVWMVRGGWRAALWVMAGFAIGPVLSAMHGLIIGWDHFWNSFVEHTFLTNSFLGKNLLYHIASITVLGLRSLRAWMVPGVLSLVALLTLRGRKRWFGGLWMLSALGGIAMGGGPWLHYYYQLVPTVAFLSGPGLAGLAQVPWERFWRGLVAVGVAMFIMWELPPWLFSNMQTDWQVYDKGRYEPLSPELAEYIESQTTEYDTIYVAFTQAELYYLANRRGEPVQMFWYEVANSTRIFNEIIFNIREREPAMVVWAQDPPEQHMTPEEFEAILLEGYIEDRRFGEMRVFRRK
jgi:hypothetical protein